MLRCVKSNYTSSSILSQDEQNLSLMSQFNKLINLILSFEIIQTAYQNLCLFCFYHPLEMMMVMMIIVIIITIFIIK